MKQNKESHSKQKRATLSALKKVGITSAVLGSMGTQWMKPVVSQVVLPAHAEATPQCPTGKITAELLPCSGIEGGDIDILISASGGTAGVALTLSAVPSVTATGWPITSSDPVPATITPATPYKLTISGPVTDFDTCMPATDIPINDGQPLGSIVVKATLVCTLGGSQSLSVDIFPQLVPTGSGLVL